MKMVKSLLLGTAAGLVAVAGAQAADLPVKAKPVEYVKICTLYGDGFYYIPGTDTCLKLGGYVRADYGWNVSGARTPHYSGGVGAQDRTVSPYSTRHRLNMQIDTRTQTAYGTLRTFTSAHLQNENGEDTTNASRAFIQWAGFTFGRTASFTDPPGSMGDSGFRSIFQTQNQSDTGANGTNQIAYTWELGNGTTLSVGADERRQRSIYNASIGGPTLGSSLNNDQFGSVNPSTTSGGQHPTPWLSLKVNQAWGQFGTAIVANKLAAIDYTSAAAPGFTPNASCVAGGATPTTTCGYPKDEWGWASLTGIEIKLPWIAPGDRIGGYFNYGVGASRYSGGSNLASPSLFGSGNTVAVGWITDAVFVNGGGFQQTTAWTAAAAYEHYWTRNFSTTVYGTYSDISYNSTVVQGRFFCGGGGGAAGGILTGVVTCDPGFKFWTVGTHTDWFPVAGFRLGVDVLWTNIESKVAGQTIILPKFQARPAGAYLVDDEGILSVAFRAQRSFPAGGE